MTTLFTNNILSLGLQEMVKKDFNENIDNILNNCKGIESSDKDNFKGYLINNINFNFGLYGNKDRTSKKSNKSKDTINNNYEIVKNVTPPLPSAENIEYYSQIVTICHYSLFVTYLYCYRYIYIYILHYNTS